MSVEWILTILIAFWGLPLVVVLAVGLACPVFPRFRKSVVRVLGLQTDSAVSQRMRSSAAQRPLPQRIGDH